MRQQKKKFKDTYGKMSFDEFKKQTISDDVIQQIIDEMDEKDIMIFPYNFSTIMKSKESLNDLLTRMDNELSKQSDLKELIKYTIMNTQKDDDERPFTCDEKADCIKALNEYSTNEELLLQYDKDYWMNQVDGFDKDISFIEEVNDNQITTSITSVNNDNPQYSCYVDVLITKGSESYDKKYQERKDKVPGEPKDQELPNLHILPFFNSFGPKRRTKPEPFDDKDEFGHDFDALFNIGNEPWQNSFDYITTFHRKLTFRNIYNRETLKIHASFGNPSNNYYVGNSHVYFEPIKYYKLNSKDDKFWIEFYSGRNQPCPINIPEDEGFVLEMLFMQNQKLLYI